MFEAMNLQTVISTKPFASVCCITELLNELGKWLTLSAAINRGEPGWANMNRIWHLRLRCCPVGCCSTCKNLTKGQTHLLASRVSTEPAEGLPVDMWPPSLSPSCSQMSLTSPKLQVLSSASLSGLKQALRRKEGKLVQGKKGVGGRMQNRTPYKRDGKRESERERDQEREKTHWTTSLN